MFMLQYDPQKDFEPISLVSSNPLIIVAKKAVPANDLEEFVAWLKANPNQALQGTTAAGGLSRVGNPSNVARAMWRCSVPMSQQRDELAPRRATFVCGADRVECVSESPA